ncbi:hypothetical protein D6850_11555 [Roseovarius spongiae]|uniref:Uncharacterized protein n=1 Tax=Roseovarius spongiae TaxID=2320272 RepID=A0A3A8ATB1_9RHOB|nr:hypothetical protein [Roseovarius spongiae]RKF13830.1 hypothetical protein D6850_11555 [Roseovarius spongiae]
MTMSFATDITTLESLRRAKTEFHNNLCRASTDSDPGLLQTLRSENVFVLTEFLFLLRAFDLIAHPARLERYILTHNDQLQDLIDGPERRRLMGLEVPRLKRGMFSMIQIHKAKANLLSDTPGLDQADIQRLTIMLFSPETGRRVIENMERAGFLSRIATPYYSKIVQSHGVAEDCFARYLAQVRADVPPDDAPQEEIEE